MYNCENQNGGFELFANCTYIAYFIEINKFTVYYRKNYVRFENDKSLL